MQFPFNIEEFLHLPLCYRAQFADDIVRAMAEIRPDFYPEPQSNLLQKHANLAYMALYSPAADAWRPYLEYAVAQDLQYIREKLEYQRHPYMKILMTKESPRSIDSLALKSIFRQPLVVQARHADEITKAHVGDPAFEKMVSYYVGELGGYAKMYDQTGIGNLAFHALHSVENRSWWLTVLSDMESELST